MGLVFFTGYLKKLEIGNKCMKFKGLNLSVTEIMKLSYFQPNLKNKTQKNTNRYKNTIKYLSGLAVSLHPKNRMIYYVSTLEGCVVKVSTVYLYSFRKLPRKKLLPIAIRFLKLC